LNLDRPQQGRQNVSNIAPLLDRNRAFAADPGARRGMPRLPFIPN
jgi:hypothetical protein